MSEPESFTAAQASDPQTPGQVLADIAALRPDLRAGVAANPSAYPGLLEWLGSLGEPAVDAAIAGRRTAAAAPQPQYQQPPAGPATSLPPQGQYAPSGPATAAPYGQVPPGGYGYGPGAPPPKKSHTALWVVLGVVGLLIVLGVAVVVVVANRVRDVITEYGSYGSDTRFDQLWDRCAEKDWAACDELYGDSPTGSAYEDFGDTCGNRQSGGTGAYCVDTFGAGTTSSEGSFSGELFTYGDDVNFDGLWDACDGGDMQACDDLFMDSPIGSAYEDFGDTCGNRQSGGTGAYCVDTFGTETTGSEGSSSGEPFTYGDDAYFDGLWDACDGGDMQACDELYGDSPIGSVYEDFGDTCGNRQSGGTGAYCVDTFGEGSSSGEPFTYGDDAYFDGLWDACDGGDWPACDELFMDSPIDSEYETYGDTCGGRQAEGTGAYCVDTMG